MLRLACIAVHARGFVADQRFDGMSEHHFAFPAPAVDGAARFDLVHLWLHSLILIDSNVVREADGAQPTNDIPADIHLPPLAAEAGRSRIRVMIAMPILSPGR